MQQTETQSPDQRLDEAIAEYLKSSQNGSRPNRRAFLDRYPHLAAELSAFFADLDDVDSMVTPLRSLRASLTTSPGTRIGEYAVLEEVARGGMGVIFRARHLSLNRIVALKMLLAGPWATSGERHRFRAEAEAIATLDHPHIVPVYEVGEFEGLPFYTMRWLEGGSLAQRKPQDKRLPSNKDKEHWAASIVETIARAVHYAHQRGILHRDIKPANILLDAGGVAHISDFGLAKRVADWSGSVTKPADVANGTPLSAAALTQSGAILGTPSYMAPEQAAGIKGSMTVAADVYGLGAVLYELLTNRPPFRAESPLLTLRDVVEREPIRPCAVDPTIDRDLQTICLKCLEKNRESRYVSAQGLAEDLQRWQRGEPIHARPVGRIERAYRWYRRQPLLAGALAIGFLGLVAVFVAATTVAIRETQHAAQLDANAKSLESAVTQAQLHAEEADRERKRAEESFRITYQVVSDFCLKWSENLAGIPGAQDVRKKMLEAGLQYYRDFVRERGHDPKLRAELAETHFRRGLLAGHIGARAEAWEAYSKAFELFEALLRDTPNDVSLKRKVANSRHNMGVHDKDAATALASFQKAQELYEAFLRDHPGDMELAKGQANNHNSLAYAYRRLGRGSDANTEFARARDLWKPLSLRYPKDRIIQGDLALVINNIGVFQKETGQMAAALQSFQEARAIRQKLVDAQPRNGDYQLALAASWRDIGRVQSETGRPAEGMVSYEKALAILEAICRDNPSVTKYQLDLAGVYQIIGMAERDAGHRGKALNTLDKARALFMKLHRAAPSDRPTTYVFAQCLFQSGVVLGSKDSAIAVPMFRQAQDLLESLLREGPREANVVSMLGKTLNEMALTMPASDRKTDALPLIRQGIEYQREAFQRMPQVKLFRIRLGEQYRALALVERDAGHAAAAVAATLEYQRLWPGSASDLYRAAGDIARAVGIAEAKDRDRDCELAVAALRAAIAAGFHDWQRLEKDDAFHALKGRADFEALLARAKKH